MSAGILIAIIGVLHCCFAPMMFAQMQQVEALKDKAEGMIYFFVIGGIAFSYCGLLITGTSKNLLKHDKWSHLIPTSAMVFISAGGITAVTFAKFGNPLIYAMTFLGLSSLLLVIVSKVVFSFSGKDQN
jgi:hypothetical protein